MNPSNSTDPTNHSSLLSFILGPFFFSRQRRSTIFKLNTHNLKLKATSKNVIPVETEIQKLLTSLDSRLRGSDELGIIRGSFKI